MKTLSLSIFAVLTLGVVGAQNPTEKPEKLLYCGMQYDQDTTKIVKPQPDTLQVQPAEIRVKQSKKSLPIKEAKPEPLRRND